MRALITGASGFIGRHLARHLAGELHSSHGASHLRCLVRKNSDLSGLAGLDVELVTGDVVDSDSLVNAVAGVDVVYHLAGAVMGLSREDYERPNVGGCRNLGVVAAAQMTPPVVVLASSMAAAGPSPRLGARREADVPQPVSMYGHSKLAGERVLAEFASEIPLTVVRPAIVYGEWDVGVLEMFKPVLAGWSLLTGDPAWRTSFIDVRDVCSLLTAAGVSGERVRIGYEHDRGCYFGVGADSPRLDELGPVIARALDQPVPRNLKVPAFLARLVGVTRSIKARAQGAPIMISADKIREVTHGPWYVSGEKAKLQLRFEPRTELANGFERIAHWYMKQGWL
jgi:nucleoside-diphosphate-sugar epimerase